MNRELSMHPLVSIDPWLGPYVRWFEERDARYRAARAHLDAHGGLLGPISQGHHYFGFKRGEQGGKPGIWYREWAPAARSLLLVGEFNNWDQGADPLSRDEFGVWSLFLPDSRYAGRLVHGS